MEKHIVTIQPNGLTTIEVKGIKGRSCTKATAEIEKALGTKIHDRATPEMYEKETTIQNKQ